MMVVSRSDSKRRRKDAVNILQETRKRTKVHAQRKFAQGSSNLTSPVITPVKDKVKVNGVTPPSDVLPVKRPNTEDFLTFLCFRSTKVLPARLDFFSNASTLDQDEDGIGGSSNIGAGPSRANLRGSGHEKNSSEKTVNNAANVRPRNQPTSAQGRAVKALIKKYHEQRLAKQKKTSLTKLVQKVKVSHVIHQTRYGTRAALQQEVGKKQNRPAQRTAPQPPPPPASSLKAKKAMAAKPAKSKVSRVVQRKNMRVGLRSGGQLPPGSDIGIKFPMRRPRMQQPVETVNSVSAAKEATTAINSSKTNSKVVIKPAASSISDSSSDDDQPLVKKYKKEQLVKVCVESKPVATRSRQPHTSSNSSGASSVRPSRKTKEAATLYMEMLGKNLRNPDEYDDDALSVESFPELPNTKKIELREKELKALAEKNKEDKVIVKKEPPKEVVKKINTPSVSIPVPPQLENLDDRSKRMLLRNKVKSKLLKKDAAKKLKSKALRAKAVVKGDVKKSALESQIKTSTVANKKSQHDDKTYISSKTKREETPDEKSTGKQKRPRRVLSTSDAPKIKKPTSVSSSSQPQQLKNIRTSSTSSERLLRVKQSLHLHDDTFSDSDEEPLDMLSAKLPKKKKLALPLNIDDVSVVKKETKEPIIRTPSLSPDNRHAFKHEKPKPPHRQVDVKEEKCVSLSDKINEKQEEEKPVKNVEYNKKSDKESKGKVKNAQKVVDIGVTQKKRDVDKKGMKNLTKQNKKKSLKRNKLINRRMRSKSVRTSVTKCQVKLENLDIRIAELRISKNETDEIDKPVIKSDTIRNKFKEDTGMVITKKVSKSGVSGDSLNNLAIKSSLNLINKTNIPQQVSCKTVSSLTNDITTPCKQDQDAKIDISDSSKTVDIVDKTLVESVKQESGEISVVKNVARAKELEKVYDVITDTNVCVKVEETEQQVVPANDDKVVEATVTTPVLVNQTTDPSDTKNATTTDDSSGNTSQQITESETVHSLVDKVSKSKKIKLPMHEENKKENQVSGTDNKFDSNETKLLPVNNVTNLSDMKICDDKNKDDKPIVIESENKLLATSNSINVKTEHLKTEVSEIKEENPEVFSIVTSNICTSNDAIKNIDLDDDDDDDDFDDDIDLLTNISKIPSVGKDFVSDSTKFEDLKTHNKSIKSKETATTKTVNTDVASKISVSSTSTSSKHRQAKPVKTVSFSIVTPKSIKEPVFITDQKNENEIFLKPIDLPNDNFRMNPVKKAGPCLKKMVECSKLNVETSGSKKDSVTKIIVENKIKTDKGPIAAESKKMPFSALVAPEFVKTIQPYNDLKKLDVKLKEVGQNNFGISDVKQDKDEFLKSRKNESVSVKIPCTTASVSATSTIASVSATSTIASVSATSTIASVTATSTVASVTATSTIASVNATGTITSVTATSAIASVTTTGTITTVTAIASATDTTESKKVLKRPEVKLPLKSNAVSKQSDEAKSNSTITAVSSSKYELINKGSKLTVDSAGTSSPTAKSRQSVNDTWRLAFKNAKIPKPGQCSPIMTDTKPFVRKPFLTHTLKKQLDFDAINKKTDSPKFEDRSSSGSNINIISPFSLGKSTNFLDSTKTVETITVLPNDSDSTTQNYSDNVIDPETLRLKESEVQDFVRTYFGGEMEEARYHNTVLCSNEMKLFDTSSPCGSVTSIATEPIKVTHSFITNIITDKSHPLLASDNKNNVSPPIITFTSKSKSTSAISLLTEDKPVTEQRTGVDILSELAQSVSAPKAVDKPVALQSSETNVGGKHHHLPLPVEQTLKRLSQTKATVNRKLNASIPSTKQLETCDVLTPLPVVSTSQVGSHKESNANQKSEICFNSDIEELSKTDSVPSTILTKKKVNMSTEDINKWLNDSTSAGIEHTKNCGIFEKNQCECKPTVYSDVINKHTEPETVIKDCPVREESEEKFMTKDVTQSENIKKKESIEPTIDSNVDVGKTVEKIKDLKTEVVKGHSEKKVNITLPIPIKQVEAISLKPDPVVPSIKIASTERSKTSSDIVNRVTPLDSVTRKVSRGTNKMGDSENETSSRDPSEVSSPPPRDDVSSADESPEKFAYPERRSIFQRRSVFRLKPTVSRSPSAFSPENESSVYAFEPDLPPTSTPFRRNKAKEGRVTSRPEEDSNLSSASIAVQCNLDNETVLECSTQTETDYDEGDGHLFYIPFHQNTDETAGSNQQMIQGLAFKLGTEGHEQRFIMRAKLVTKLPPTFASSTSRSLVSPRDMKANTSSRPEQKVKPLSVSSNTPRPPVGTVQPTARTPNPPEIQPPPPIQTLTPEKVRKVSRSPETHKKEISATQTVPDELKMEQPAVTDKPGKVAEDVAAITTNKCSTATKASVKTEEEIFSVPEKSKKVTVPSATAKNKKSTPGRPKRTKVKGSAASDSKGSNGYDSNIKLEDAPSFRPSEREFQNPLEYIEKIRPFAEKFGLCRVIPPSNFKPECKVSDDMRFTAYNQYVHKMLHRWGPNVKEMLAIKRYLATQSIALTHPPWVGGMELDLPKLYQTVQNCGGLQEVIERKRWHRVADAMHIPLSATKLDDIYCKFLLPYDTLSHGERTKLFEDVEKEWEKRMATGNETETSSDDSTDNSELDECIVKGRTMTLSGFYRIARNTMAMYFRNDHPSAQEVESEFWNHVGTRKSHICVHSGSIDSGDDGYGFPTAKNSSTTRHPWNLKVLTNNSGSILRSLGPIMGVTVPTLHVGMLFTACCWYRDPHALPWIEYLHTGASKIWYSIPDESSDAFRKVVSELVPNLCRDKTIWLASDTAMIPPKLLIERNISICRIVQEPGQFIIVFPKAFTSSVCTGYLVSESVYFAQPLWLATAQQVFKDISESSEPSMFSLERLLFSIAHDTRTHIDVLLQILPMVQVIRDTEVVNRNELEKLGLTTSERLPLNKRRKPGLAHDDDSDNECEVCRANLFLSLVTNTHEEAVYCLTHAIQLLKSKPDHLKYCKLLYTYNLDELDELVRKIIARIDVKSHKKIKTTRTAH